ncbi:MAG: PIG-L family deacetylase [Patescibacteria group bacterium]
MNTVRTKDDVKNLGTILSVWAHPDDETYTCGGLMAVAVENGQKVVCVTATRGEAGVQDESRWPADQLGQIRETELMAALNELGITSHHWLDYKDGCCCDIPEQEGGDRLVELIDKYQPDTILTFGPDGLTGHPDHQSISCWVDCATQGKSVTVYHVVEESKTYEDFLQEANKQFNIYFNIDKPPVKKLDDCEIGLTLNGAVVLKKYNALKAMPSQMEALLKNTPKEHLKQMLRHECFVKRP